MISANSDYQYRAFGAPGLGLKRGLEEDSVIAPYASALALMVSPEKACKNLESLYEKGFEACQYLAYIINNYHNLSDYTIFIHAHSQSWHFHGQMYDLIPRLDYSKLEFANLNFDCYQKVVFDQRYVKLIESLYNKSIPSISHYCCAQFVVTRDRILRNSLETYQAYDYWLQTIKEENHYTSRVFEYIWHMIFGNSQYEEPYKNGVCDLIDCNPEELKQKKILYTYRLNEDGEKIQHNIH